MAPDDSQPTTAGKLLLARDAELATAGLLKEQAGQKATRVELQAIKRIEMRKLDAAYRLVGHTIRKKDYLKFADRQARPVNDQAARYGMPCGRGVELIDLRAYIRWVHDFLAANKERLNKPLPGEADPMLVGSDTPALERYRAAKADMAELNFQRESQNWVAREEVRASFGLVAGVLRQAGELLQKRYGPEALQILNEAIDGCGAILISRFGHDDSHSKPTKKTKARPAKKLPRTAGRVGKRPGKRTRPAAADDA